MTTRLFEALGVGLATLVLNVQAGPVTTHYISQKQCGFEFDYPTDWVATPLPDDQPTWCRVQLRPNDFAKRMAESDVDLYTLEVSRYQGNFLAAADQSFDFVKGKWVILGRQGMHTEAEVVVTDRWNGLKGVASVGCYHDSGGYAGLCEEASLVLRDKDDNVWAMRGGPQAEDVFSMILATFQFVEQ
jgi:hypothetical protein